jgi:hypothetical protein
MAGTTLYLSSLDSVRFETVRECQFERTLSFDTGKVAIETRISPAIVGQDFSVTADIDRVILAPRHEGATIDPVSEFPLFVFIAIPSRGLVRLQSPLRLDDLDVIGWGELYRSSADAEGHVFG